MGRSSTIFCDRKGQYTQQDTLTALAQQPDRVLAVGLDTAQDDAETLRMFARDGYFGVAELGSTDAAFEALADRVVSQIEATYVLGYCTERRGGAHTVGVTHADATQRVTGSVSFNPPNAATGCTLAALESACDDFQCGAIGCGTCGDFATERCNMDHPIFTARFPGIAYTGEGFQCTTGVPESHPVPGAVIDTCYSSCTVPNHCCRSLNDTLWLCQTSTTFCGDFGTRRDCDNSEDCTPGSFCCYAGGTDNIDRTCQISCPPADVACVDSDDCAPGQTCSTDGLCTGQPT